MGPGPSAGSVTRRPIGRGSQAVGPRTALSRHNVVAAACGPRRPLRRGPRCRPAGRLCGTLGFGLVSLAGRVTEQLASWPASPTRRHGEALPTCALSLIPPNAQGFRPPEASPGSQRLPGRPLDTNS